MSKLPISIVDYLAELKMYTEIWGLYYKPDGFEIVDSLGNRWHKFNGRVDEDQAFFLFCNDGTRSIRLVSSLSPWAMFEVEPVQS